MSAYEQKKEAWDKSYQYLLFAADPYEVVAFKIPNLEVDRTDRFFSHWCGPASQGAKVLGDARISKRVIASILHSCWYTLQLHRALHHIVSACDGGV